MTNLPLNIDIQQILLHLFNFTILFGALYFLLYSPVVKFMKQREDYYKDLEDKAKANVDDTQKTKEEYEAKLAKADEEIKVIKTEAGEAAEKEHERIGSEARSEADKILKNADIKAQRDHDKMIGDAKKEIADLVSDATEKIVMSSDVSASYDEFLKSIEGEN
ncbi:MAG: ATP synthase F0 subunit B [Lachnospiraceae bacterium]|nr:ATP synthase F0 subunit B [Lachnospiraceae bacterium]